MTDPMAAREEVLAKSAAGRYILRLYVSGQTPRSASAIANIRSICEQFLKERYELTVIDLFEHPEDAQQEQVIAVPTLVKRLPPPLRRLIGDLSDRRRVLLALDLQGSDEP